MIPSDIRLYTWVNVEEVFLRIKRDRWPNWLICASAYWDRLKIEIRPGYRGKAKEWLREVFETKFRIDSTGDLTDSFLILEGLKGEEITLPIWFEETEERLITQRVTPSLSHPTNIFPPSFYLELPESLPADFPPVVAFHSFKGGVGRTTHALALARALTEEKKRVLLIDGDLEAPGINWILESKLPAPSVSLADFIALVHGDPSSRAEKAVQLVSDRLKNTLIDNIYFLPAFRSTAGFTSLEIKPEHLMQGDPNAFLLTDVIANLGKALEVDFVLIDLRSGLSELASPLILDPRVYRVLLTTLSETSLAGTNLLLELMKERSLFAEPHYPLPAFIFTKVPQKQLVAEPEQKLLKVIQPFFAEDRKTASIITPFDENLLVLPQNWEEVITLLVQSGMVEKMRDLLEWLPRNKKAGEQSYSLSSARG